jgi:RNA polymerase sigma-70 factor (ECF subfamily)
LTPAASVPAAAEEIDSEVVALVQRAQRGDNAAFAQLYDRYLDAVYGYVQRRVGHRQTAEDLTGDVFMRAYRRLDQFEWQGKDLRAWIMTIARNRVHDHFKSSLVRLERSTEIDAQRHHDSRAHGPEEVAEARDVARALGRALEQLKDDHREVIELRFIHELSVAETAQTLKRTVGATKALQYRALRSLAEIVKGVPGLSELAAGGLASVVAALTMLAP